MATNSIPQSPPPAPPLRNIDDLEERISEAMADHRISTHDAQEILDATDPEEKISLAVASHIVETNVGNLLLDKIRSGLTDREWDMVQPYNAKVRETVWRALNPTAAPGATMPENFEIPEGVNPAEGLRAKAEGFITARQDALRARSIAAILGELTHEQKEAHGKKWFSGWRTKKGYSLDQREKMLEDLKGSIPDDEYQTLDTKLKRERTGNPAYEPAIVSDGTMGGDIAAEAERTNTRETYNRHITGWEDVEQTKKEAYDMAGCAFYGELGQQRFLKERDALLRTSATDPTLITDAAEIARREGILKRRIATEVLVQSMRGADMDFEKMKREQFLEYADQKEKGRLGKTMEACLGRWNKLSPTARILAGASIGALAGTAVVTLTPAITLFGLTFFGSSFMVAPTIFGTRLVRSTLIGTAMRPAVAGMQHLRMWKDRRARANLEKEHGGKVSSAVETLGNAATFLQITEIMQNQAEETRRAEAKLTAREQSVARKLVWGGAPAAALAVLLVSPKAAQALTIGKLPSVGNAYASQTAPTTPSTGGVSNSWNWFPRSWEELSKRWFGGPETPPSPKTAPPSAPSTAPRAGTGTTDLYRGERFWEHPTALDNAPAGKTRPVPVPDPTSTLETETAPPSAPKGFFQSIREAIFGTVDETGKGMGKAADTVAEQLNRATRATVQAAKDTAAAAQEIGENIYDTVTGGEAKAPSGTTPSGGGSPRGAGISDQINALKSIDNDITEPYPRAGGVRPEAAAPTPDATPAPSGAGASTPAPEAIGRGNSETLFAIGRRGPQGAIIEQLSANGMDPKEAGKLAHLLWLNHAQEALKNPDTLAQLKKLGYKPDADGYAKMMHRIGKGTVRLEFDNLGNPKKMELVDMDYLKNRPRVSHQPTAADYRKGVSLPPDHPPVRPTTTLTAQEPVPGVVARGSVVPTIEYKPVGGGFSQEYQEIQNVKVLDFVNETNRLLQEQTANRPLVSETLPHAYEAGQLDRYARMENQIAAHAKKFKLTPEQMKNMRMDQLFVPKGGPRVIDTALNQPAPAARPAGGQLRMEDSTTN